MNAPHQKSRRVAPCEENPISRQRRFAATGGSMSSRADRKASWVARKVGKHGLDRAAGRHTNPGVSRQPGYPSRRPGGECCATDRPCQAGLPVKAVFQRSVACRLELAGVPWVQMTPRRIPSATACARLRASSVCSTLLISFLIVRSE